MIGALEEIREMMFSNKLVIGSQNTELIEEMRAYHRDEDFRVVKLRDDLVSAMRYAIMMRRSGRALSECEGIGYGNLPLAKQRAEGRRSGQQFARGTANHPDGDNFDIFTGAP